MKLGSRVTLWLTAAGIVALPIVADARLTRSGTPSVSFTAVGPGGLKIVGNTADLTVDDASDSVTVSVPLANLTTGIALRDRHMREKYLQVQTYPAATLKVDRAALKLPAAGAETSSDAPGTMTLHGQNHSVTFHYNAKRTSAGYAISGSVKLDMKAYGIDVPSYLGVTVKPDVDVAVQFVANES